MRTQGAPFGVSCSLFDRADVTRTRGDGPIRLHQLLRKARFPTCGAKERGMQRQGHRCSEQNITRNQKTSFRDNQRYGRSTSRRSEKKSAVSGFMGKIRAWFSKKPVTDPRYGTKFSPLRKARPEKKAKRVSILATKKQQRAAKQVTRRRRRRRGFKPNSFSRAACAR